MIQIRDLQFKYSQGGFALDVPQFEIENNRCVAVVGASGIGKSTLLKLIAGVYPAARGSICVLDTNLHGMNESERRRFRIANFGFVFQEFDLIDYLSVRENLLLPYWLQRQRQPMRDVHGRAEQLAATLGIADKLDRKPDQLSHGQKQRVAIGRAIITQPRLILADEPTGSLDPTNASTIADLLIAYARQNAATLICATHDQGILPRFDQIVDVTPFTTSQVEFCRGGAEA